MACWISIFEWVIQPIAIPVQLLRVRRPIPARPPRPLRHCIQRRDRERVAPRHDRIGRDEAPDARVIIARINTFAKN